MTVEVLAIVKRYYHISEELGYAIPSWAHCCMWYYCEWPAGAMPELGDFGIRQDYDEFNANCIYRNDARVVFPPELSQRLAERKELLAAQPGVAAPTPMEATEKPPVTVLDYVTIGEVQGLPVATPPPIPIIGDVTPNERPMRGTPKVG